MKEFLSRAGRTFVARDVEEDDQAYRDLIALGCRFVPVTVIGGRTIRGFNEQQLSEALAAAES